jgi:methylthioribose-1-phosphate isomerase
MFSLKDFLENYETELREIEDLTKLINTIVEEGSLIIKSTRNMAAYLVLNKADASDEFSDVIDAMRDFLGTSKATALDKAETIKRIESLIEESLR